MMLYKDLRSQAEAFHKMQQMNYSCAARTRKLDRIIIVALRVNC
jgi:hypothetical protein